jgi:hypothetical protein
MVGEGSMMARMRTQGEMSRFFAPSRDMMPTGAMQANLRRRNDVTRP